MAGNPHRPPRGSPQAGNKRPDTSTPAGAPPRRQRTLSNPALSELTQPRFSNMPAGLETPVIHAPVAQRIARPANVPLLTLGTPEVRQGMPPPSVVPPPPPFAPSSSARPRPAGYQQRDQTSMADSTAQVIRYPGPPSQRRQTQTRDEARPVQPPFVPFQLQRPQQPSYAPVPRPRTSQTTAAPHHEDRRVERPRQVDKPGWRDSFAVLENIAVDRGLGVDDTQRLRRGSGYNDLRDSTAAVYAIEDLARGIGNIFGLGSSSTRHARQNRQPRRSRRDEEHSRERSSSREASADSRYNEEEERRRGGRERSRDHRRH